MRRQLWPHESQREVVVTDNEKENDFIDDAEDERVGIRQGRLF